MANRPMCPESSFQNEKLNSSMNSFNKYVLGTHNMPSSLQQTRLLPGSYFSVLCERARGWQRLPAVSSATLELTGH